jgi:hypothetical protein
MDGDKLYYDILLIENKLVKVMWKVALHGRLLDIL